VVGARDGSVVTLTVRTAVGAVLGHVPLTYEADVTGEVAQIYGRQLDEACSAMVCKNLVTPPLLDNLLIGTIFNEAGASAQDLPPRAFELLFESTKYVTPGNA